MRLLIGVLVVVVLLLPFSVVTKAQDLPATCADWSAVQSWTGTITYSGSGSGSKDGLTEEISEHATINFTTEKSPSPCDINGDFSNGEGITGWSSLTAKTTYSVTLHDVFTSPQTDSNGHSCTGTINYDVTNGTASIASAQVNMNFASATSGTHLVNADQIVDGVTESFGGCGHSSSDQVNFWLWGPSLFPPNGVTLPAKVGPVSGNLTFTAPGGLGEPIQWTVSWTITPNINYEVLLITSPDYADWRPASGKSETDFSAGILGVNVYVADKDTGQSVANLSVDGWKVELKDVSHEPGVSMNYPPKNKLISPSPPDLDFKDLNTGIFPNVKVSDDGLTLTATPDPSTDNQLAFFMNSRDWGAWGTLNITITLAGQTFKAHFAGDETTDILLPKRQQGSFIADSWKTAHNLPLETADSDDSEAKPNGEPECVGDGLTLYEEYRGFMEGGKHIEGDPAKKDFFVRNIGGGDLKPGIMKFTQITGLNVHKDLRDDEIDGVHGTQLGDRLINFNHAQAAHEVDQHGVILAVCGDTNGGATILNVSGVHGRPGLTNGICMEWRDHPGGPFDPHSLGSHQTHGGVITPTAALQQYDIAVAHELAHSVGADHHGEGDIGSMSFTLLGPNDPANTTGQPVFTVQGQGGFVHLLQEDTKAEIAPIMWSNLTKQVTDICGQVSAIYSPQFFSGPCRLFILNLPVNLSLYMGRPNALHSGNDQCIMRYFFANGYPSAGSSTTFYVSPAGTEPLGTTLCTSPAGTGINDPNHKPQPRFFGAASGRGNCKDQICVNDKYAPIPD